MSGQPNAVVILGCGESINNLSDKQRSLINDLPNVYALNKFAIYWKRTGIIPKKIWFTDRNEVVLQRLCDVIDDSQIGPVEMILQDPFGRRPKSIGGRLLRAIKARPQILSKSAPFVSAGRLMRRLPLAGA